MELRQSTRRHLRRTRLHGALLVAVLLLCACGLMSHHVARVAEGHLFDVATAPRREVAIVPGALVFGDGTLAATVADRVLTAVELYRAGKVRKLLFSGDNGRSDYDEPSAMKRFAVRQGVPEGDIVLDYAGFHTYDTCYRGRAVFGVRSASLVTQEFHLQRSVFLCRKLGIDAVGVRADRQAYQRYLWYLVREQAARVRAFVQVYVTRPRPRFLGPSVPMD